MSESGQVMANTPFQMVIIVDCFSFSSLTLHIYLEEGRSSMETDRRVRCGSEDAIELNVDASSELNQWNDVYYYYCQSLASLSLSSFRYNSFQPLSFSSPPTLSISLTNWSQFLTRFPLLASPTLPFFTLLLITKSSKVFSHDNLIWSCRVTHQLEGEIETKSSIRCPFPLFYKGSASGLRFNPRNYTSTQFFSFSHFSLCSTHSPSRIVVLTDCINKHWKERVKYSV